MDISSLRDRPDLSPMTVSELNEKIKHMLEADPTLARVSVRGEISNFVRHGSGHLYFTLKDGEGQIRCVMFRSSAVRLRFVPTDGMKIQLRGSVSVYTRGGSYQLYVEGMEPDGIGALYLAYEQLKERLTAEGLFDEAHKRPLPRLPRRIGVITSPTGAAVRDIIDVTGRRFPLAQIFLYPSLVQGDGAEAQLLEALRYFETSRLCDVIIIGRGGGSIEDLWAFNSEALARAIYNMTVPVISAVGHETDFTICDFVADCRAPTPSAAAELATPDGRELSMYMDTLPERMKNALSMRIAAWDERLSRLRTDRQRAALSRTVDACEARLAQAEKDAVQAMRQRLDRLSAALAIAAGKADAMSPLAVLRRGYAIAVQDGAAVSDVTALKAGQRLDIYMEEAVAETQILSIRERKRTNE